APAVRGTAPLPTPGGNVVPFRLRPARRCVHRRQPPAATAAHGIDAMPGRLVALLPEIQQPWQWLHRSRLYREVFSEWWRESGQAQRLFLNDRVVALAGQAGARGFCLFHIGKRPHLHAKISIASTCRKKDRILLLT